MSFRMIVVTAGVLAVSPAGAQEAPDPPSRPAPASSGTRVVVGHARIELPSTGTATSTLLDGTPTRGVVWRAGGGVTLELFAAHGFFVGKDIPKALEAVQSSFGRAISKTDLPLPGESVGPITYAREITLDGSVKRLFVFEDDLYVVSASFRGSAVRAAADRLFGTFKWGPIEGVSPWLERSTAACMCQFGMPNSTEKPTSTSKSPGGSTQNIWITDRDQGDRFVVMVGLKSAAGAPADAMVEAAAGAALRGKKGEQKAIKIGSHPGRELVVTADGATTFTRMYVANGHLYAIAYSAPTASIDAAARDEFFASFIPRASVTERVRIY